MEVAVAVAVNGGIEIFTTHLLGAGVQGRVGGGHVDKNLPPVLFNSVLGQVLVDLVMGVQGLNLGVALRRLTDGRIGK